MTHRLRFALWLSLATAFVLGLFAIVGFALWFDLEEGQRTVLRTMLQEKLPLLLILAFLLLFLLGALLRWGMSAWPLAAARMAEEVALVHTVNPSHRVSLAGAQPMRQLGDSINALAEAHRRLQRDVQQRVDEAHAQLTEEKNRLAALMSELAHSVLVCNREGRILLYNERAAQLLGGMASQSGAAPVGLGRSVFAILDQSQIVHALDRIGRRIEQQAAHPAAHFVTARSSWCSTRMARWAASCSCWRTSRARWRATAGARRCCVSSPRARARRWPTSAPRPRR